MEAQALLRDLADIDAGAEASLLDTSDRDGAAAAYLSRWLVDRSALWFGAEATIAGADANTVVSIQMSDLPEDMAPPTSSQPDAPSVEPCDMPLRELDSFDFPAFRARHFEDPDSDSIQPPSLPDPTDDVAVSAAASAIISVLTLKRFRRGPASDFASCAPSYHAKVCDAVRAGRAVELVMPAFPVKCWNPLKVERRGVDLGELVTLCRLYELCRAVERVYAPGAHFIAIADGLVYAPLFEEPSGTALAYRRQLQYFARALGVDKHVKIVDMAWLIQDDPQLRADFESELLSSASTVAALWALPDDSATRAHRDQLVMATRGNANVSDLPRAVLRSVLLGRPYAPEAGAQSRNLDQAALRVDLQARRCAFNYAVFVRAVNVVRVVARSFPHALRATCHPKPGQLGLHLVHASSFNYPWNGVTVVKKSAEVRPFRVKLQEDVRADPAYRPVHFAGDKYPFFFEQVEESTEGSPSPREDDD